MSMSCVFGPALLRLNISLHKAHALFLLLAMLQRLPAKHPFSPETYTSTLLE